MKELFIVSLIATLVLLSPLVAEAQNSPSVRKIGFLGVTEGPGDALHVLQRSLAELGYVKRQNIVIEVRAADTRPKLLELANELIREKVEVIVASGGPATRSAQDATKTIPIVFATSGEPVEAGFVASPPRPGAQMTAN